MGKKHEPEEIVGRLSEAEIVIAQGGTVKCVSPDRSPSRAAIAAGVRSVAG
jgi:hypothetical protein